MPIRYYHDFQFQYDVPQDCAPRGVEVHVRRIVARNPGAFTGPGTNTYIVGDRRLAVIDPGPALDSHIRAILEAVRGGTLECILLTHHHVDHWPAAAAIHIATGAPICAYHANAYDFEIQRVLGEGDVVEAEGWKLEALHTPGHASDHLCFCLQSGEGERLLFSGDHVMGWSTSIIMPPDGDMAAYLRSLERLLDRDDRTYLPGHGAPVTDPPAHVRSFIEHRRERREAILRAIASGDETVPQIVRTVYYDVGSGLHWAAAQSTLAHLIELEAAGEVQSRGERYRLRGR